MDEEFFRYGVTPEELAEARRYTMVIEWSPEDEVFLASFPDAPTVQTHGATREEATERGEEAIVMWLTALRDAGLEVPPAQTMRNVTVAPPPRFAAAEIRNIRHDMSVSQKVFAELLGASLSAVRSWEQGQRIPDGTSRRLLEVARVHPKALLDALLPTHEDHKEPRDELEPVFGQLRSERNRSREESEGAEPVSA